MARTYAGILGLVAFLTSLARGLVHGGAPQSVLAAACGSLLAFALVGCAVGWVAGWIVDDSVRSRLATELAVRQAKAAHGVTPGEPT